MCFCASNKFQIYNLYSENFWSFMFNLQKENFSFDEFLYSYRGSKMSKLTTFGNLRRNVIWEING